MCSGKFQATGSLPKRIRSQQKPSGLVRKVVLSAIVDVALFQTFNADGCFGLIDHPGRANFGDLRHHLLEGAATPPLQGEEYVRAIRSSGNFSSVPNYTPAAAGIGPRSTNFFSTGSTTRFKPSMVLAPRRGRSPSTAKTTSSIVDRSPTRTIAKPMWRETRLTLGTIPI